MDIDTLILMAEEENDPSLVPEIGEQIDIFTKEFEEYRINLLFTDEFDDCNAVLTLHSGEGGTESCDWASMLYRMYTRWAEKHGFKVEVLDYLEWAACVRISQVREGSAQTGKNITIQFGRQKNDLVCIL